MSTDRLVARKHADWLSMIEISGPFLSMPVLLDAFPQGLDARSNENELRRRVRLAYDEWIENQESHHPDPAIHRQWLLFVLQEVLEMRPDVILEGQQIPANLCYDARGYGETIRPLFVIQSPFEKQPRLLIQHYSIKQDLGKVLPGTRWNATPATRMMELLRACHVCLGLVTNGREWMLVDASENETTGFYTWNALLWAEEPLTLQAFHSLLGMERFFNVPPSQTLEALLRESAQKPQEVTNQLGDQVRRAVQTLVQMLDRLDKERQRTLLAGISEKELYQAALTVMMRLVFLLSAEEREMLLLDEPLYDLHYAVSTLYQQLREQADQQGEEVMGLRYDAWSQLLAVFRIVYGGIKHPNLQLPAYGGHLFDPDRFPFLEGRASGTVWRETFAHPLRIDNRTVMHLLHALQYLQTRIGGIVAPRRLSFRGLDIEQIGHVYEGLLDHTAKRAETTILGLIGASDSEPEATLEEIEQYESRGLAALLSYLEQLIGRKAATIQKHLAQSLEKQQERSRLMEACDNKQALFDRILPYAGLIRKDTFGNFVIVTPGSVYVTHGSDRRSTGTHYTPRSLTEQIVQHALDPIVYKGPAEGWPREEWQLRSAAELLDLKICDLAMGSGAFLVQTCRYLSEKLVEAWDNVERELNGASEVALSDVIFSDAEGGRAAEASSAAKTYAYEIGTEERNLVSHVEHGTPKRPQITPEGQLSLGSKSEELLPLDNDERLAVARRLVAERCLYGVDKNPMAVEMAKLSLWLITMAKHKPFTFLDHNLRSGDSLLGANERQLYNGSLEAKSGVVSQMSQIQYSLQYILPTVILKRREIATLPDFDISYVERKEVLLKEADQALAIAKLGADMLIGIAFVDPKRRKNLQATLGMEYVILAKAFDEALHEHQNAAGWAAKNAAFLKLRAEVDELLKGRRPFHWPLEFPEVFVGNGDDAGFNVIVGNPPFQGGQKITGMLGTDYRDYLVEHLANGKRGSADLCSYFFLRATNLAGQEGMCALLATNTIAQGDTREVGLDQIVASGWTIPRAIPSRKWPGEASLEVAHIWLRNGSWDGSYVLDDKPINHITAFLTRSGGISGTLYKLASNANKSFQGVIVLGMGFVLDPREAQALLAKDPRNKDVLFPYLNGEDLNSRSDQSASRWVINFHDWSLEHAETYTDCMKIVREKVKPERDRLATQKDASARNSAIFWWQFRRKGQALYSAIVDMKRVLVCPRVTKYLSFSFVSARQVFMEKIYVFLFDRHQQLALLNSNLHEAWTREFSATLGNTLQYAPTDCFENFPFPTNTTSLEDIGERYYTHRQSIMLARQEGLTKTYNRFHNPLEQSPDIIKLRQLHTEMDEAVAHAYGWDDLKLEHDFHETKQGLRYTISEAARREVLDRLLLLNHAQHEEEVKVGLFEMKGAKERKGGKGGKNGGKNGGDGEVVEGGCGQGRLF